MNAVVLTYMRPTPEYRREKAIHAVFHGLTDLGWNVRCENITAFATKPDTSVDLIVSWGATIQHGISSWRNGRGAAVAHIPILSIEGGCFEDHPKMYRVGIGFPMRESILWADPAELPTPKVPERQCTGTALIAGQDIVDPMLEGLPWGDFVANAVAECSAAGLTPFYRRHPRPRTPDRSLNVLPADLPFDDEPAWWGRHTTVITATSTFSVVAATRGCQVIACLRNNPMYGVVPSSLADTSPHSEAALLNRLRKLRGAEASLKMLSSAEWLRRPIDLVMGQG